MSPVVWGAAWAGGWIATDFARGFIRSWRADKNQRPSQTPARPLPGVGSHGTIGWVVIAHYPDHLDLAGDGLLATRDEALASARVEASPGLPMSVGRVVAPW